MDRARWIVGIVLPLALAGCGFVQDWSQFTVGDLDAGPDRDAGPGTDGGPGMDASVDAGAFDAGSFDAGLGCVENPAATSDLGMAVFMGDTVAAAHRLTPSCAPGGGTAPDRQFQWTAPATGTYRFTTEGSSYDTVLSVQATCDGMEIACNDDTPTAGNWSMISIELTVGQTVILNVDGFDGGTGSFQINIEAGGCGDGTVQLAYETCDDANRDRSDGCSDGCLVESVEGALRIVDGPDASEGRLEIFHMAMWGTVCDDPNGPGGWDDAMEAANVACRQLGFASGSAIAADMTADGPSAAPTWLDEVTCTGTEARLTDCDCGGVAECALVSAMCSTRWGCENCTHREDVGVDCVP